MNNPNLFYEATDISTPTEVKAAYEYAVENNKKYYRAISKANHSVYGWDTRKGQYIMLDSAMKNLPDMIEKIDGAYWFINDKYKEQTTTVTIDTSPVFEVARTEAKPISYTTTAKTVAEEDETPYIVDYKALYERILPKYERARAAVAEAESYKSQLEDAKAALAKKTDEYNSIKAKYVSVKEAQAKTLTAIDELANTLIDITDDLDDLKNGVEEIKILNLE